MALTIEWKNRVDHWRRELLNQTYRVLGDIDLSAWMTTEQLSPADVAGAEYRLMRPGTKWGRKWEYAWFRGSVTTPEEARGRRLVARLDPGGESAVYVNGKAVGARDHFHREITLTTSGSPGQVFELLLESYGGHGPMVCSVGPVPPDRETVPEPPETQREVGRSTFGIWREDVYQLWVDVETLYQLRESIDPNSLRVSEIDKALREFTVTVDFELPEAAMLETVARARKALAPLLRCTNGSTAPTLYAFGHSHIDVAWLWPLAETERKCVRTFSTQLELMKEYPEYRFLQSQAHLYRMVKNRYPELYERVKQAVKSGQFMVEGGMWVEADTNVSGGEGLIRQFIHGKRFFRQEFGVDCEMLWLPDVFGYSGALPQILRGCGIKYFSTAKIFWNYNGGDPFPHNTFTWEGIDGSQVLVHLCNDYNSQAGPKFTVQRWNERVQKDGIWSRLYPFGWGDGGGGPTRDHCEFLRRQKDLEGCPRVKIASPIEYFKDLEKQGVPDVRYVGELYYQCHRGTYTSQAKTKKGNRQSELALREAEMWGAVAQAVKESRFPKEGIDENWKTVLLHQFHDILPGSSIQRVYEEAEAGYRDVIAAARKVAGACATALTDGSKSAVTVFNSLSWERPAIIALPKGFEGAALADGTPLPVQKMGQTGLIEVRVPSCGWISVVPGKAAQTESALKATERSLENELIRAEFNDRGEIVSLLDKETGRQIAAGPCNALRMYKDVPAQFDAWDIDSMYARTPVALDEPAAIEVILGGPLIASLRVKRMLNLSMMTQDIILRRGSRRIDFRTKIEWAESHKLLKVCFPVNVYTTEAIHEIQFGHIRRPNHQSRPFDADRFEVCNHKWSALAEEGRGVAVLNDCKYGLNVLGNSINLTLLKSALAPDMRADKGTQEFAYSLYSWNGSLADSEVVREAYDLNCPVMPVAGAAETVSTLSVDAPNVVIETVKPAEDGSKDVVVRLYECKRMTTRCILTTSLPAKAATLTNMIEEKLGDLDLKDGKVALELRPFEIKTVRLRI